MRITLALFFYASLFAAPMRVYNPEPARYEVAV
jgi:hypothetical protein